MLIYNPIYDLFHCSFRQLQILYHAKDEIRIEKMKILDFYLTFPSEILRVRLPKEAQGFRKYLRELKNPYEIIIDNKRLFLKMEPYQVSASNFLSSLGIIDHNSLEEGFIKKTSSPFPEELLLQIELRNKENAQVINIITQVLMKINLNGPDGLKARTNLMEYKYDIL